MVLSLRSLSREGAASPCPTEIALEFVQLIIQSGHVTDRSRFVLSIAH